jgi:hypothetical protein
MLDSNQRPKPVTATLYPLSYPPRLLDRAFDLNSLQPIPRADSPAKRY